MYKYTEEQLISMKKVEETREERMNNLFPRMTAEEKDAVLKAVLTPLQLAVAAAEPQRDTIKYCTNSPIFCRADRESKVLKSISNIPITT